MSASAEVKSKPILFSSPMVRAILDGRKTQTRRIVKPQPVLRDGIWYKPGRRGSDSSFLKEKLVNGEVVETVSIEPPEIFDFWQQHKIGERLWVRETWGVGKPMDSKPASRMTRKPRSIWYAADERPDWAGKTRPSIFMPRWASRITLEITDVRVERLNDISEKDAEAEGFRKGMACDDYSHVKHFQSLWEKLNGKDSWSANPWVWCISFKRI